MKFAGRDVLERQATKIEETIAVYPMPETMIVRAILLLCAVIMYVGTLPASKRGL